MLYLVLLYCLEYIRLVTRLGSWHGPNLALDLQFLALLQKRVDPTRVVSGDRAQYCVAFAHHANTHDSDFIITRMEAKGFVYDTSERAFFGSKIRSW